MGLTNEQGAAALRRPQVVEAAEDAIPVAIFGGVVTILVTGGTGAL